VAGLDKGLCPDTVSDLNEEESPIFEVTNCSLSFSNLYSVENMEKQTLTKIDVSVGDISLWLEFLKLKGTQSIFTTIASMTDKMTALQSVENDREPQGLPCDSYLQITYSVVIDSVSVFLGSRSKNNVLKPITELNIRKVAMMASNFGSATLSGSLLFDIELATYNFYLEMWEIPVDTSAIKIKFVLPQSSEEVFKSVEAMGHHSGSVLLEVDPLNITIRKSMLGSLSLCTRIFNALRKNLSNDQVSLMVTSCEIKNLTESRLALWLSPGDNLDEDTPEFLLDAQESCFPLDAFQIEHFYRAGPPNLTLGVFKDRRNVAKYISRIRKMVHYKLIKGSSCDRIRNFNPIQEGMTVDSGLHKFSATVIQTRQLYPGCWLTELHGAILLVNRGILPIEVAFQSKVAEDKLDKADKSVLSRILPNDKRWLPLEARDGYYFFRTFESRKFLQTSPPEPTSDWTSPVYLKFQDPDESTLSIRLKCQKLLNQSDLFLQLNSNGKSVF